MKTLDTIKIFKPIPGWKIQLVILFYLGYLFLMLMYALWVSVESFQSISESLHEVFFTNVILMPISGVILLFGPIGILRKRLVRKIEVPNTHENSTINIKYKGKDYLFDSSQISYAHTDHGLYSVFIIYYKFENSRGLIINEELCDIIGFTYGLGWNQNIIMKLIESLDANGVEKITKSSHKNILSRLMTF